MNICLNIRLTQTGRNEGDAVGDHGALHDVQLGQDDEDEEGESDGVHRLEDPDDDKVGEGGTASRLEDADSGGAKEAAEFGDPKRETETPNPSDLKIKGKIMKSKLVNHGNIISSLNESHSRKWAVLTTRSFIT